MKDDKRKPGSKRQKRQALRLGVKLEDDDTVHSACQKLNAAAQAEAIKKGKGHK